MKTTWYNYIPDKEKTDKFLNPVRLDKFLTFQRFRIIIIFLFFSANLTAQNPFNDFLNQVKTNNKALITAKEQLKADETEAKTNLNPANPEVEFGYLFGTPEQIGNRTDFSVMQNLNFPTYYFAKQKSSGIMRSQAQLRYQLAENHILVQAKIRWYERIYLNQKHQILTRRLQNAEQIFHHYERKFSSGECNQLQLNQARLQFISMKNETAQLLSEIVNNQSALNELSGGTPVNITETELPATTSVSQEEILQSTAGSSRVRLSQMQSDFLKQEIAVRKNQVLPQLKVGYYRESITSETFSGFKAGISIPLWNSANQVKLARYQADASQAEQQQQLLSLQSELQQKFNTLQSIITQVQELKASLQLVNDEQLLGKALQAGEISLTEYYYETGFYFQNQLQLLDLQKKQLQLQAEIEGMVK